MKFFPEVVGKSDIGRSNQCSPGGFTLIELLIVMAVIAAVSVAAAPRVAQYMRNVSLRNAVYQISGDLHVVKTQAVRSQQRCAINFDNVNGQYTLGNPINRTVSLGDYGGNVAFTADPGGVDPFSVTIQFTARGLSDSITPGQVFVTNQDNRIFRIQASPAGAISIQEWIAASNSWK